MIRAFLAGLVALVLGGPALAAVEIQEVTSPGGIRAWLVEDHSLPFTALDIRFRGGTSLDAPDKRGATYLMTGLIEEGAGDLDAQGFAAAQETLGAEFSFDADPDTVSVSARFLTDRRAESVALLKKGLTETRFDPGAIERVKGQVQLIIRTDAQDPETLAARGFAADAFGAHPYATAQTGSAESVAALSRDDILAAKAASMARDRMYVAAVGDISPAELGPLLDDLLGGLPATGAALPPRASVTLAGGDRVIDYPGPQSVVAFGQPGLSITDPDLFPALVLNQILGGGGFSSRLMDEVREKRGLTYGISTGLVTMDLADTWQGGFAAANDKVAEAIALVRSEWLRAATEGVSDQELEAAKTYLTGSYPLRFSGNGPIAGILVGMQLQGFPTDYVKTRNEKVAAVTAEDVRRVAARLMTPEGLHFVIVGQPATGN